MFKVTYRCAIFVNVPCCRRSLVCSINQILPTFAIVRGGLGRKGLSIVAARSDSFLVLDTS
jgi:hypothetical protein